MKTFTLFCHNHIITAFILCCITGSLNAQEKGFIKHLSADTSLSGLNMDASYKRPFLSAGKMPVALGGYVEANSFYGSEDGVSEGWSFQARRLTMFMSASISKRIRFLSEIEFEEGGKEITIEFAAMDLVLHQAFNFRGGIIMNPIGAFNQNHDGPKWEFVERPDVAVNMLPATWSNAGFGFYGKTYRGNWILGYETYLSNGFDNSIIDNEQNKTFLPAAKTNEERFEESNNGRPLFTGKIVLKRRNICEIGFSYMGGAYNKFEEDGLTIEKKRRADIFAVDINTVIQKTGTTIIGEAVYIKIDVPDTYTQQFGSVQQGTFIDIVQPIFKKRMLDLEDAVLNVATRLDYADWNIGKFNETGTEIGDFLWAVTPAVSFRPSSQTVFRLNYRYQWQTDILNNPSALTAAWLFGFSTYF